MTRQEAMDYLEKLTIDTKIGNANQSTSSNLINMSMEALEKQIPVKIKQDIVNGKMARWCPNGCEITHITQYSSINYCPKCGQAIKWD